uniref:Uncharacterized protein n=1 Tax=Rhizophora mucronata TaxID=61149 RepID=A0A2P2M2F8_RHIMU
MITEGFKREEKRSL